MISRVASTYNVVFYLTQVWSLESGDCQLTLPGDHSTGVSCVTFNEQWVISGDNSGEIKVLVSILVLSLVVVSFSNPVYTLLVSYRKSVKIIQ